MEDRWYTMNTMYSEASARGWVRKSFEICHMSPHNAWVNIKQTSVLATVHNKSMVWKSKCQRLHLFKIVVYIMLIIYLAYVVLHHVLENNTKKGMWERLVCFSRKHALQLVNMFCILDGVSKMWQTWVKLTLGCY